LNNVYQAINAMDAYKNFSFEELRLKDYEQGRKYGTSTGQPGGFGASNFGGFGTSTSAASGFGGGASTGGGLFGTSGTSGSFGQQQQQSSGFGSGTSGGGLFGSKPSGGLFGGTTTTSQSTGGLFGTSGTTGGFGGGTSGGGLFGASSTQNKPTFGGGFGSGTTGGGFGASTTSSGGGGLFGSTTATTSGFGSGQSTTGGFGGFGQQPQQQTQTGGGLFGSGGAFGATQQPKPGGLFGGSTTTGGSLFGQQPAQQQATGTSLFGNAGTQQSGGLFGNKPATTGGLFGGASTGTGGGLFGGAQQQPAQTGGLFGSTTQQPSGGLFGSKPTTTGTGLFGSTAQQPSGSSLFGSTQQQPQPATLGSSLFSSTLQQPQQQQPQQPPIQTLSASLTGATYGSPQLFAGLETPTQSLGPIATPLSSAKAARKQAIIPSYRINPSASSRLITPQKRPQGYGFSYSTYGTPGSASPSPAGFNNRLLTGGSIGRTLGKSYSSSNLRNSFTAEDSLLMPGAFATSSRSGTGSIKKLNINRNLNSRRSLFDDFDEAPKQNGLRKKVSFDAEPPTRNGVNTSEQPNGKSKALVAVSQSDGDATPKANGVAKTPEMEQAIGRGKELATVPEDSTPPPPLTAKNEQARVNHRDMQPGDYWMKPSQEEIEKLPRDKRKIKNFMVGREGCGKITFSEVDLATVPLDRIFGDIVQIELRQASVYTDNSTKPPVGKGLNVPSEITLDNCFPRAHGGKAPVFKDSGTKFEKHIVRLKRIDGTHFVNFDSKSGQWTFRVDHYTTYGLDYDDDESMLSTSMDIPTPTPLKTAPRSNLNNLPSDASMPSPPESDIDDTFDFKKFKKKEVPGQFDDDVADADETMVDGTTELELVDTPESFLDERSVGSLNDLSNDEDIADTSEFGSVQDQEMAGSFPLAQSTEHTTAFGFPVANAREPKSILKRSASNLLGTPGKINKVDFGADWTEQLQRTVSPRKQDRQALRESQAVYLQERENDQPSTKVADTGKTFNTSIDLMHSLFGQSTRQKVSAIRGGASKGFEVCA
jgi:nuclear pore complex protein Nup98-Nup96